MINFYKFFGLCVLNLLVCISAVFADDSIVSNSFLNPDSNNSQVDVQNIISQFPIVQTQVLTFHPMIQTVLGSQKAPISIVEFFDYNCPYCKSDDAYIKNLIANDKNLRVVYREVDMLGGNSGIMARAALSAGMSGRKKYLLYHELLFKNFRSAGTDIYNIAEKLKLNKESFSKNMFSYLVTRQLDDTKKIIDDLNIHGVPTFLIAKVNFDDKNEKIVDAYLLASPTQEEISILVSYLERDIQPVSSSS